MRVLIVEDNAFNAFCLRRLLESVVPAVSVTAVTHSNAALSMIKNTPPNLVVIDGDLGASRYNGPQLAHMILQKHPNIPLIAWSDSEPMRELFAQVFKQHDRKLTEYNTWTKVISSERIYKTWAYYFGEFMGGQHPAFAHPSFAKFC